MYLLVQQNIYVYRTNITDHKSLSVLYELYARYINSLPYAFILFFHHRKFNFNKR